MENRGHVEIPTLKDMIWINDIEAKFTYFLTWHTNWRSFFNDTRFDHDAHHNRITWIEDKLWQNLFRNQIEENEN